MITTLRVQALILMVHVGRWVAGKGMAGLHAELVRAIHEAGGLV